MAGLLMASREIRRVPAEIDCPLGTTWPGYLEPDEIRPLDCPACGGSGYGTLARWLRDTFYALGAEHLSWRDKLTQDDVDALVEGNYLRRWDADGRRWEKVSRTAEEVKAAQRAPGALLGELSIDGGALHRLVEHRCGRLGADARCATCRGDGEAFRDAEHRAAHDAWSPTSPPEGDHVQLWQTVSEGGPVSPAFPDTEEGRAALADWLTEHHTIAGQPLTRAEWRMLLDAPDAAAALDVATGRLHTAKPEASS